MDEALVRERVQRHADAVVAGDMETVLGDIVAEIRDDLARLGKGLPQPVVSARVESVEISNPTTVAVIRYSGADGASSAIRSEWEERAGEPMIVRAEPAA